MTKSNIDNPLKEALYFIHGVDTNQFEEIKGDLEKKSIYLEGQKQSLLEFIDQHAQSPPIALDFYSTKKINQMAMDAAISEDFKEKYKTLYVERDGVWEFIEYSSERIGILNSIMIYNGYPNLIDSKELVKDPREAFSNIFQHPDFGNFSKCFADPTSYSTKKLFLHKNFLEKYFIEDD